MDSLPAARPMHVVGRYVVHDVLASGGMASVHLGRLQGPVGFSRTVAIKILHPHYANDPEFVAMFVDEARLAARISHPNVVATLDVVATEKELLLVMDYVPGETLARLLRLAEKRKAPVPPAIVVAIVIDLLDGLHAAHEARDEDDAPLAIVHRDVSPQNVMVGHDGTTRVLDFGIAKATFRSQLTRDGQIKGKFAYMAPEQVTRQTVDRRTDVFAAGIVLWEALTGSRLFAADDPAAIVSLLMNEPIVAPSALAPGLPPALDDVVLKALCRDRDGRYATAGAFARALENALTPARRSEVREWVGTTAGETLAARAQRVAEIERGASSSRNLVPEGEALTTPGGPSASPVIFTEVTTEEGLPPAQTQAMPAVARRPWFSYAGAIALVASIVFFLAVRHSSRSGPDATSTGSVVASSSSGSQGDPSTPGVAPSLGSEPVAVPTLDPPPVVAPVLNPKASSRAAVGSPAAATPRAYPHPGTGHLAKICDPPYTYTDAGAKRWKPACL